MAGPEAVTVVLPRRVSRARGVCLFPGAAARGGKDSNPTDVGLLKKSRMESLKVDGF